MSITVISKPCVVCSRPVMLRKPHEYGVLGSGPRVPESWRYAIECTDSEGSLTLDHLSDDELKRALYAAYEDYWASVRGWEGVEIPRKAGVMIRNQADVQVLNQADVEIQDHGYADKSEAELLVEGVVAFCVVYLLLLS